MAESSKYTTEMYLNLPTTIKVTMSASRTSGSTTVHFSGTLSETQNINTGYNLNAIYAAINEHTNWIKLRNYGAITSGSANFSFDVDVGGYGSGSRSFDAKFAVFNNAESGTVGNTAWLSINVGYGESATQPPQPTVSVAETYANGAKFNVSVSNYGSPGSTNGRYIEAAILNQSSYGETYKYNIASNTTSSSIIVTNNTKRGGSLTIKSNTQYFYGGYVSNTVKSNSKITGQFYTRVADPVASSFNSTGTGTATFNITDASEGSAQSVQLQYCIKKHSDSSWGSWINAGGTGNKQTRSVSLSGLEAGTAYDVKIRARGGSSDYSPEITYQNAFTTSNVGITITGSSSIYNGNTGNSCTTTFSYVITAAGSSSDKYDITITMSGANTYTSTFNNKDVSGTFSIDLPPGEEFAVTVKARPVGQSTWGTATSFQFTSPSFVPGAPFISGVQWTTKTDTTNGTKIFRYGISANLTAIEPGEGEQYAKMRYQMEWYDENAGAWVGANPQETTNTTESLYFDNYSREPRLYPKVAITAWQDNDLGTSSDPTRVVFINKPLVSGVVVSDNSDKDYVVSIKTKDTAGNLNSGSYECPLIIK